MLPKLPKGARRKYHLRTVNGRHEPHHLILYTKREDCALFYNVEVARQAQHLLNYAYATNTLPTYEK